MKLSVIRNLIITMGSVVMYALLITSCSDDVGQKDEYLFSVEIDGVEYKTEGGNTAYAKNYNGGIAINGILDVKEGVSVYLKIPHALDPGTYSFSDEIFASVWTGGQSWSTEGYSRKGTISIDAHANHVISGSFNFTAYSTKEPLVKRAIKSGEFRVIKR